MTTGTTEQLFCGEGFTGCRVATCAEDSDGYGLFVEDRSGCNELYCPADGEWASVRAGDYSEKPCTYGYEGAIRRQCVQIHNGDECHLADQAIFLVVQDVSDECEPISNNL